MSRRRNPFSAGGLMPVATKVVGGLAGGVAAGVVPGMIPGSFNTGWLGVLAAGAVSFIGSGLLHRVNPNISEGWLIGGLLQTAGRTAQLLVGRNLVSFSLSGYGNLAFPTPTPGYRQGLPASAVVASVPAGGSSVTKPSGATVTTMGRAPYSKYSYRAA